MNELEIALDRIQRIIIGQHMPFYEEWELICEKARNWDKFENMPVGTWIEHISQDAWCNSETHAPFFFAKEALESLKQEPELLNCPFCGSKPKVRDSDSVYQIACLDYRCLVGNTIWYSSKEEAIRIWNTRK